MFDRRLSRAGSGVLAGLAAAAWLSTAAAAAPDGTPLFIELPTNVLPAAVGANGFVVVGSFYSGGAFHWMPTSGVTPIGGFAGIAVSRDGETIVGNKFDESRREQAAIWVGGTEWRLLGSIAPDAQPCDLLLSSSYGASGDGSVVVGLAWNGCKIARAFRWEESTGMVDLGTISGGSTRANGVSANGRVVVGWDTHPTGVRQGARWVDGKGELFVGPSGWVGEAFGVNSDGSLIVGGNCDPASYPAPASAWTWTQAEGIRCFPVRRPSWAQDLPYQVLMQEPSDDGRVIGGSLSFGLEAQSLLWFDGEPFFLRDYLREHGVPDAFQGWVNTGFVTGVSPDGRTLVGYGAGPTGFQGYVVLLPKLGAK